ncbi:MAG TPA: GIY-YIG nuclease family protein [Candidatus Paceibacterota bacterium]|jgi:putative endonuclease|nr:GIY-YIG nuclease family protein [Candidatus Paceibacterota bacterium]
MPVPLYFLYVVRCADGTLYTGITTDVDRRVEEHNSTRSKAGAKYTRARQPVALVYSKPYKDRSAAAIAEAALKKLSRKEKLAIISLQP